MTTARPSTGSTSDGTAGTSPDSDHRPALADAYRLAATIVEGIDPAQLGRPTPCPDFDVATLVSHVVGAGWRAVELGRGESPTGTEFPAVPLADAPVELRRAGEQAGEAWADDARLAATVSMPWGETYDGTTLVDMYLTELATHAFDLAAATGQLERLDPALAPPALAAARSMLHPEYRDMVAPGSPFGQEVPAPEGASEWERLAAFMGRQPRAGA